MELADRAKSLIWRPTLAQEQDSAETHILLAFPKLNRTATNVWRAGICLLPTLTGTRGLIFLITLIGVPAHISISFPETKVNNVCCTKVVCRFRK